MSQRGKKVPDALTRDTSTWAQYPRVLRWGVGKLVAWDLVILAILGWLLLARFYHWWNIDELPNPIANMLPLVSPWAGALGGVGVSLVGIAAHAGAWGPNADKAKVASEHPGFKQHLQWNVWHITRPFVGALFGSVAVIAVVFVIGAVGVTGDNKLDVTPLGSATLFAVAFLVGYRDSTFRLLAERVIDTIFGPGSTGGDSTVSFTLSDSKIEFGSVKVNATQTRKITLENDGAKVLTFDSVTVAGIGFTLMTSKRPKVGAYGNAEIEVQFSPTAGQDYDGTLTVKLGDQEKTVDLTGRGTT